MKHPKGPRGDRIAARIRAAAAYADLNRGQLGEALGYSVETVSALFAGQKATDIELRRKIAATCGVPAEFMEYGFDRIADPIPEPERRVRELLEQVQQDVVTGQAIGQEIAARLEVHHLTPLSEGGTQDPENLVVVDPNTHRLLHQLQTRIGQLEEALDSSNAVDFTRVAIDEGRAATTAALESAGVAGSTPAAEPARDEGDASPEAPALQIASSVRGSR